MTRNELIELLNEMYTQMTIIANDLTEYPCEVQNDVNELYNLAQFLPYTSEADEEDEEDEEDDIEALCDEAYTEGRADGYEEGYDVGYNEAKRRFTR